MRLKSYFAGNIGAALSLARQELGSEAVLVRSRPAPPEARHLGECEVVVAADAEAAALPPAGSPQPEPSGVSAELTELRRQVERMAAAVARSSFLATPSLPSAALAEVFSDLVSRDVDPEIAHDVVSRLRAAGVAKEKRELRRAVAADLAGRFRVDSGFERKTEGPRVVALAGPTGSGKTTTLVKLAVRCGVAARRPVQILSMDNDRIAAADQLRAYSAVLGVGFQALETPAVLGQAIEECRYKDLVLIDTPGYGSRELDAAADLARILAGHPAVDVHLVLTASLKPADLSRAVDRFEIFRPNRLLFTKLDETESFGPLLSEAVRTGKPVSFLTNGQAIPEDLEPATSERLVDLVLNGAGGADCG
jgi:flagellar biosynthesis protein FlhF